MTILEAGPQPDSSPIIAEGAPWLVDRLAAPAAPAGPYALSLALDALETAYSHLLGVEAADVDPTDWQLLTSRIALCDVAALHVGRDLRARS